MTSYAFIDIETIGFSAQSGNIIEIAIITHDGMKFEDEFHSLVKPKKIISRKITQINGIRQDMVDDAPDFWSIAKKIVNMTQDRVLVGHNISFDYGFLRSSFREVGFDFSRDCLCTLRMARQCLPQMQRHDLNGLATHLNLPDRPSHRALSDVKTTIALFFKLRKQSSFLLGLKTLSPNLMKDPTPSIPASPGVYLFYDKEGTVIYVGRSNDLKSRIKQHIYFQKQHAPKNRLLHKHIAKVEHLTLGDELIAAIEELHLIKKYRPRFNAVGKKRVFKHHIIFDSQSLKYSISSKAPGKGKHLVDSFGSKRSALKGLENLPEIPNKFNSERSRKIWINKLLRRHSYPKQNFTISLKGRSIDEHCKVHIKRGCYKGYSFIGDRPEHHERDEYPDIKRLLCKHMLKSHQNVLLQ